MGGCEGGWRPAGKDGGGRRPNHGSPTMAASPACGWWSCRCRAAQRRCRWSLRGRGGAADGQGGGAARACAAQACCRRRPAPPVVLPLPPASAPRPRAPEGLNPCRSLCMYNDTSSSSVFSAVRSTKGLRDLQRSAARANSSDPLGSGGCGGQGLPAQPACERLQLRLQKACWRGWTPCAWPRPMLHCPHAQAEILQQVGLAATAGGAAGARHGCWRGLGASAAPVTCN